MLKKVWKITGCIPDQNQKLMRSILGQQTNRQIDTAESVTPLAEVINHNHDFFFLIDMKM